jgi:hypothetical protein
VNVNLMLPAFAPGEKPFKKLLMKSRYGHHRCSTYLDGRDNQSSDKRLLSGLSTKADEKDQSK